MQYLCVFYEIKQVIMNYRVDGFVNVNIAHIEMPRRVQVRNMERSNLNKQLTEKRSIVHIQRVVKDIFFRDAGTHLRGTFFCVPRKETGTGLFHGKQGLFQKKRKRGNSELENVYIFRTKYSYVRSLLCLDK